MVFLSGNERRVCAGGVGGMEVYPHMKFTFQHVAAYMNTAAEQKQFATNKITELHMTSVVMWVQLSWNAHFMSACKSGPSCLQTSKAPHIFFR